MTRSRLPLLLITAAVVAALGIGFATGNAAVSTHQVSINTASELQQAFVDVFTKVSPSGKELMVACPSGTPMYLQMRSASSRLAEPLKTFISG